MLEIQADAQWWRGEYRIVKCQKADRRLASSHVHSTVLQGYDRIQSFRCLLKKYRYLLHLYLFCHVSRNARIILDQNSEIINGFHRKAFYVYLGALCTAVESTPRRLLTALYAFSSTDCSAGKFKQMVSHVYGLSCDANYRIIIFYAPSRSPSRYSRVQ